MPRKRYLSTTAGSDRALAKVSPLAAHVFLLAIPHADGFGRLPGDVLEFIDTVAPARRLSEAEAEAIVAELVSKRLLIAWQFMDKKVLAFKEKAWIVCQGRALHKNSRPEQPEPPAEIEGVLRVGFSLLAKRQQYGVRALLDREDDEEPGEAAPSSNNHNSHNGQSTAGPKTKAREVTEAQRATAKTQIRDARNRGTWEGLAAFTKKKLLREAGVTTVEEVE